jgi:sarcosine oxidase subunit gamma
MVEIVSALAGHLKPGRHGRESKGAGVIIREVTGRDLVQVAWWPGTGTAVTDILARELDFAPAGHSRRASDNGPNTAFLVAPDRLWIAAPLSANLHPKLTRVIAPGLGVVTELGHSRTVLRLSGPSARDVLARHIAVDLDKSVFPPGSFASTSVHQVGILLHYVRDLGGAPMFDLYLLRTFALSLFEGLTHTAESYGFTIEV